ncbi:tetratricopeptide repeat protein [bacterium]|nr:tetratricopeptide repeat protein [bacterium]
MEKDINLANKLVGEKKFKEALEVLTELEENVETLKLTGLCYLNINDYVSAKNKFESVVKYAQDDATSWYYLAICYDNLDDYPKSKFAYNEVIRLREQYLDAYKNLGVIYLKTREDEKAFEIAKKGIDLFPEDYLLHYLAGSALMTMKKFQDSLQYFETALDLNNKNVQIYCNYGTALMSCQRFNDAIEMYNKAIEIEPNNAIVYHNLASLYQIRREFDKAIENYKKAYEIDPNELFMSSLALAYFNAKDFKDATELYLKLVQTHPERQNYRYNLACCFEAIGEIKSAITLMEQLVALNPKAKMMVHKLAIMYEKFNQPEKAKLLYESMIANGFVSDEIYYSYAITCTKTNDIDTAERILKKVIELNPHFAVARKDLGVIYLNKRLFDYAEDEFKKAYETVPTSPEIVFEYANFLQAMNKYEQAKDLYDKAITLNNKNPRYFVFASLNAQMLKDMKSAVKYIEDALKLIPNDPFILLNAGKIYYAAHKYDKAQFVLVKSWEINQNVEVENLIGLTYFKQKEYEKALTVFEKLSKEYPTNTNILMSYAQTCEKTGNLDEAKTTANKILEIFDDMPEAKKLLKRIKKTEQEKMA